MTREEDILQVITGKELPDCPGSYNPSECNNSKYHFPDFGHWPVAFSLLSCSLSVLGSIVTVLPYLLWKDVRTGTRRVITYLAIADFFTALGYIMASINYLVYERSDDKHGIPCARFGEVCEIQAYIASWSSYSSFWWTFLLALFFYWAVAKGGTKKLEKVFPLYHVLSWGSPILVMFPLLVTGSLGYSIFASGGWCFIKGDKQVGHSSYIDYHLSYKTIIKVFAGGKAFEIFTYIWIVVMYCSTRCRIRRKQQDNYKSELAMDVLAKQSMKQLEKKLFFIPFAFILLRMWGTIQFFFSIAVFEGGFVDATGCVPNGVYRTFYALAILQSMGDGGQGWCNALLYIFLSPAIRERLILKPLFFYLRPCIRNGRYAKRQSFRHNSTITAVDESRVVYHVNPDHATKRKEVDEKTTLDVRTLHISEENITD